MNSILKSIKPKWVAKILNGEKTVEVSKTAPKDWTDYLSGKTDKKPDPKTVYIYATKDKRYYLDQADEPDDHSWFVEEWPSEIPSFNGKVLAKFTLENVHKIDWRLVTNPFFKIPGSCLSFSELIKYATGAKEIIHDLYGWYISDLVIFDRPMELEQFAHYKINEDKCKDCPHHWKERYDESCSMLDKLGYCPITKAPQSWCFVEEPE